MDKHWWFKNWRMDEFLPNSPMLEPSKVSLHTVHTYWLNNYINSLSLHGMWLLLTSSV